MFELNRIIKESPLSAVLLANGTSLGARLAKVRLRIR